MRSRVRAGSAVLIFAAAAPGCVNLSEITPGCGNGVVDPGEDCDQQDQTTSGDACWPAQSPSEPAGAACRFKCTSASTTPRIDCPAGFGCGLDGVCRRAENTLSCSDGNSACTFPSSAVLGVAPVDNANDLLAFDLDGDSVPDIVASTTAGVTVAFANADRTTTPGGTVTADDARPTVGILTPATSSTIPYSANVTLTLNGGLDVFTTSPGRTLTPVSYAGPALPGMLDVTSFVADLTPTNVSSTWFLIFDDANSAVSVFVPPASSTKLSGYPTLGGTRAGPAVAAPFDIPTSMPPPVVCEQVAVPFNLKATSYAAIFSGCASSATAMRASVVMPVLARTCSGCKPLHALDVNGDGAADLIMIGVDGAAYVAYSDGAGTFWPSPLLKNGVGVNVPNTFGKYLKTLPTTAAAPLAFAHLDGDCLVDVIAGDGIYLGRSATPGACSTPPWPAPTSWATVASQDPSTPWTLAVVGDFNGDGLLDVATGDGKYPDLTLYRNVDTTDAFGVPALFNPATLPTANPVSVVAGGDFDGDGVDDLAYVEAGQSHDSLSVVFGGTSGPPSDPVLLGQIPGVTQILPALESELSANAVVNPFVVSQAENPMMTQVYIFEGNTSRQINAPYLLLSSCADQGVTCTTDADCCSQQCDSVLKVCNPSTIDQVRRSTIGKLTSATQANADVALFSHPRLECSGCARLYLLPTLGDGDIAPLSSTGASAPTKTTLPSPFDVASDALITTVTLASGIDQVVLAAYTGTDTNLLSVPVVGGAFSPGKPTLVGGFDIRLPASPALAGQILQANVDGSGLDVVLAAAGDGGTQDGIAVVPLDPVTGAVSGASIIGVYTDINACGTSSSVMPSLRVAPLPSQDSIRKLLARDPTAKPPKQQLVAVTPDGVSLVSYASGKLTSTCMVMGSPADPQGGTAVATGDFDGDGVDDVMIGTASGVNVFYGAAYAIGQGPGTSGAP